MNRLLGLSALIAFLVAVPVTHFVWAKGHVPANKVQVCHKNDKVITVDQSALDAHLGHGDCHVPACDFNNVFHTGDSCSGLTAAGPQGHCSNLPNARNSAEGITPGCPVGTF